MMQTQPTQLRLYTFDGGQVITQGVRFLGPDGREERRDMADPNHAYLIQHPNGLLVWDTGLSDAIAARPEHALVSGRFRFVVEMPLAQQFQQLGIDPAQVNYLAFSHLQVDHAGNTALFPNAAVVLHAVEYGHAFSNAAGDWGYVPEDYQALKEHSMVLLHGDYDVFGDGRVQVLAAPGHTPGHQVLYVDLPQSGPVLLSGDLYYAAKDPAEGWMPAWNYNKDVTRQTMARLQAFAAERGARWLINHDPANSSVGWME